MCMATSILSFRIVILSSRNNSCIMSFSCVFVIVERKQWGNGMATIVSWLLVQSFMLSLGTFCVWDDTIKRDPSHDLFIVQTRMAWHRKDTSIPVDRKVFRTTDRQQLCPYNLVVTIPTRSCAVFHFPRGDISTGRFRFFCFK